MVKAPVQADFGQAKAEASPEPIETVEDKAIKGWSATANKGSEDEVTGHGVSPDQAMADLRFKMTGRL